MTGPVPDGTIAGLLEAVARGEPDALNALFPLVYDELSVLAHRQRQRWDGDLTLNTTALVHEAYLKLSAQGEVALGSRAHLLGVAARAMRHILCNYARNRRRLKRGGDALHVSLDEADVVGHLDLSDQHEDMLEGLDAALLRLEQLAERASRVVECRFFGGMSVEETAAALGMSERTVKRDWNFARAWLHRELEHPLNAEA